MALEPETVLHKTHMEVEIHPLLINIMVNKHQKLQVQALELLQHLHNNLHNR
jgi:hypothetical protein